MKLDNSLSKLPWPEALAQVMRLSEIDLDPVLVVRGDNPNKVLALREHLTALPEAFYFSLGYGSSMAYIEVWLLMRLDRAFSMPQRKRVPHEKLIIELRRQVKRLPFKPVIILDRCHQLRLNNLFRIIRLINELEGMAQFIFLLPKDYLHAWSNGSEKSNQFGYFIRIIKRRYKIYD